MWAAPISDRVLHRHDLQARRRHRRDHGRRHGLARVLADQPPDRRIVRELCGRLRSRIEYYTGTISKLGVDIGVTTGGVMVWLVFSPTNRPIGGLSGNYVGGSAEASVIAGLGANALVGGSNRSVALQPLSVQGQVGLNIAAGVAGL